MYIILTLSWKDTAEIQKFAAEAVRKASETIVVDPDAHKAPIHKHDIAPSKAESRKVDDIGTRLPDQHSPTPVRKLASKAWRVFDDTKNRWDEYRARTVNAARRSGHRESEIAQALHEALPGEAVIYLDDRGVSAMELDDMLWHLEMLFGSVTRDPELAQTALDQAVRGTHEPAHRFGKRVLLLASAATVKGEKLDLKAQRSFVAGFNCKITTPVVPESYMSKQALAANSAVMTLLDKQSRNHIFRALFDK